MRKAKLIIAVSMAVFIKDKTGKQRGPLVESFRINYDSLVVPESGGGVWLLGVFGHYIKLDENLNRADGLSFVERFARTITFFYDRGTHYNDFYLNLNELKSATMPIVLFGLPVIWLSSCHGLSVRRQTRRRSSINSSRIPEEVVRPSRRVLEPCPCALRDVTTPQGRGLYIRE